MSQRTAVKVMSGPHNANKRRLLSRLQWEFQTKASNQKIHWAVFLCSEQHRHQEKNSPTGDSVVRVQSPTV